MIVSPSVGIETRPDRGLLAGRVALVTGAASGIGRASALAFAQAEACVVVSDVDEAGGRETVTLIDAGGGKAHFVRCDVAHSGDVAGLMQATISTFGRLDCAHNNAGIGVVAGPTHEIPEEVWGRRTC